MLLRYDCFSKVPPNIQPESEKVPGYIPSDKLSVYPNVNNYKDANDGLGVLNDDAVLLHYIEGRTHDKTDIVVTTVGSIRGYAYWAINNQDVFNA